MSSLLATSTFPARRSGFSRPSGEPVPVIVAEALETVGQPLIPSLRPCLRGTAAEVVARIARALGRPVDPRPLPQWLGPEQRMRCAQLLPILERYHCALLADPVGSGKTWIGLAVAGLWQTRSPVVVVAPAAIVTQWQRTAASLGVSVEVWSHERLSRGHLPAGLAPEAHSSLVIIDESHHFRNQATRRYRCLAPSLRGRTVLLQSATPIVNSLADLQSQLALGARDDVLAPFGVPSLARHLLNCDRGTSALGEIIIAGRSSSEGRPHRRDRRERQAGIDAGLDMHCQEIDGLTLSRHPATAALIRTVLWRALASSPMALLAALRRYQALLSHARDARLAGRALNRRELRSFVGEDDQQLVMWEMLEAGMMDHDIAADDLPAVNRMIERMRERSRMPDARCRRLAKILNDGRTTLVFTVARETVRYLREHLPGVAWCTGRSAGIGFTHMAREDVLSWFRPGAPHRGGPHVLVTTDVSSEGLDLQHAARVIHYDLPWTSVRLEQRNGRVIRLGSLHEQVEVIRFDVPFPVAHRLGQVSALARKRRLPRRVGIGGDAASFWSWRQHMADRFGTDIVKGPGQYCRIQCREQGALVGLGLYALNQDNQRRRLATLAGYIGSDGTWYDENGVVEQWMEAALVHPLQSEGGPVSDTQMTVVAAVVREKLKELEQARWCHHHSPVQTRLLARLQRMATRAVRTRHARRLAELERAMAFVSRGHTAGESMWLEEIIELSENRLLGALAHCAPMEPAIPVVFGELLGLVLFEHLQPATSS